MSAKNLEREVIDFILWLTPCGEVNPAPSIKTIGREARRLYKKIRLYEARNKPRISCAACDRGDFQLGHSDECKAKGGKA